MKLFGTVLVRNILEHAHEYPWKYQDIGLLSLRLDDHREYMLHVWAPDRCVGTPPIHDHPFDFVSRIVGGEMTNGRYVKDPSGAKYLRERYSPPTRVPEPRTMCSSHATSRRSRPAVNPRSRPPSCTTVTSSRGPSLSSTVARSEQAPSSPCARLDDKAGWVSGASRTPTPAEVTEITAQALTWF